MEQPRNVVVVGSGSERPQEAGADFVPYGDDFERDSSVGEGIANREGVVVECPREVGDGEVSPDCWGGL